VGDHVFLPTAAFPSTFADSHATLAMGMGYGKYTVPSILGGGSNELSLGSFAPAVEGQVTLFSRFAINFSLTGNLITGLNTESALLYGASTSYSINGGLLYEVIRADQAVLSAAFAVSRPHTLALSPAASVLTAVQNVVGTANSDYTNSSVSTQWKPSARFSYALNSVFALKSLLGVTFLSFDEDTSESSAKMNIGFGLEADIAPVTPVPIAFSASYSRSQILTPGSQNADTLSFGLFETLSPSFNAGIEIGKVWTNHVNSTLVVANLRVYYN
jgi:hypothetical protein